MVEPVETLRDDDVPGWWAGLGLPGLYDVHVHFLPPNVQAKVYAQFDRAGPKIGREWPIRYRGSHEERVEQLRSFGVRRFSALPYAHRPGIAAYLNDWARDFAAGDKLVVCLGDNIFEHAHAAAIGAWADGALVFAKDVPDPENFGVVAYDADGGVADLVEKAGIVDTRYETPPSNDAVVGLYCYPPEVFEIINSLEPSSRGELEITDVNRELARRGQLQVHRVQGWWHDGGKHWGDLAEVGRLIEQTGVNR